MTSKGAGDSCVHCWESSDLCNHGLSLLSGWFSGLDLAARHPSNPPGFSSLLLLSEVASQACHLLSELDAEV